MGPKRTASTTAESQSLDDKVAANHALLQEILSSIKGLDKKIDKLENKVIDLENSMTYHAEVVDEVKVEVDAIKSILPRIEEKVNQQDTVMYNKAVEIQGIPHHPNEKIIDIVTCIASKIDVKLDAENIDVAYRNKTKKCIIVRFLQTHVKQNFVKSYKKTSPTHLKASDLGYQSTASIFINDHLSYATRALFFRARQFRKDHDYKYAWTSNQIIYLRKTESSEVIKIVSEADLGDLK